MISSSPMRFFHTANRAQQIIATKRPALADDMGPLVHTFYDDLVTRYGLQHDIFLATGHGVGADALAKTLSDWACGRVLNMDALPPECCTLLEGKAPTKKVSLLLQAIYDSLLLARFDEPFGLPDQITRAVLDNRPVPNPQSAIIDIGEPASTVGHGKKNVVHEVIFAQSAALYFKSARGKLDYHNMGSAPSSHILQSAMGRILGAFRVARKAQAALRADPQPEAATEQLIAAIHDIHRKNALALIAPEKIHALSVADLLDQKGAQ